MSWHCGRELACPLTVKMHSLPSSLPLKFSSGWGSLSVTPVPSAVAVLNRHLRTCWDPFCVGLGTAGCKSRLVSFLEMVTFWSQLSMLVDKVKGTGSGRCSVPQGIVGTWWTRSSVSGGDMTVFDLPVWGGCSFL